MATDGAPTHQVWGTMEVLECYTGSQSDTNSSRHEREFPQVLQEHLASNVVREPQSGSSSKIGSSISSGEVRQPPVGSKQALHAAGKCKPCAYAHSPTGCKKGDKCDYCHYEHARKSRPRPGKTTRQKCKMIASELTAANETSEQLRSAATAAGGTMSLYMETILRGISRVQGEQLQESVAAPPQARKHMLNKTSL
eukprot:TRINITY_DN67500_c0_g1_i1.p1 TRINITY_DN67500_c0_g1~~TRINITY_DN67500_c0_g1_i1.p1  ORF type:complete len:220 (+),score=17.52 TRINITY_DN67500_c0_g1_i1:73-660(+)